MPNHITTCLSLSLLSSCLFAQGAVQLNGTWRFGSIMTETFSSTCMPPAPVHAVLEDGMVTFQPGGTVTTSITQFDICPGGVCSQALDSGSANYHVLGNGLMLIDDNPGVPGEEINLVLLRSDASVAMLGRWSEQRDEPSLSVLVALSSGQSAASLSGAYGFVRFVLRNDAVAQTMRGDRGTITFDGAGGFAEVSDRHQVTWGGGATANSSFAGNGTYSVASDGTVTVGGGQGAVSPDREFVYWVEHACPQAEMVLAVRLPQAAGTTYVDGDWRYCSTEVDVVASALDSDWGTIALAAPAAGSGTLTPDLLRVSTTTNTFGTTTATPNVVNDSYTLSAGGAITLFSQAGQRPPVEGWVSRDGSVLVGAPALPSGATLSPGCGLTLGLTRCALPTPVGVGTAGTAGIVPQLFSIGGFPYAGNADFGFVVATGLGGAPGVLLFSGAALPAALPVSGFELWLDPLQVVGSSLVVLSGPAGAAGVGAAGLPLALPPTPSLAGTALATQAVVLDPAAAQGLSASGALDMRVWR